MAGRKRKRKKWQFECLVKIDKIIKRNKQLKKVLEQGEELYLACIDLGAVLDALKRDGKSWKTLNCKI